MLAYYKMFAANATALRKERCATRRMDDEPPPVVKQIVKTTWASTVTADSMVAEELLIPESPGLLLRVLPDIIGRHPDFIVDVVEALTNYEVQNRTTLLPFDADSLEDELGRMLTTGDLTDIAHSQEAIDIITGTIISKRYRTLEPSEIGADDHGRPVSLVEGYKIAPEETLHYVSTSPYMTGADERTGCIGCIDWSMHGLIEATPPGAMLEIFPEVPRMITDMTHKTHLL